MPIVSLVVTSQNNIWFARTSLLAEQVRQQHRVVEGERGTVIVHRQLVVYTDMPALLSNLALDLVVSARGAPTNGGEDMRNDDEMRVYVPSMDHATMDQLPLVPCKGRVCFSRIIKT